MSKTAANEAFARHAQARLGVTVDGWAGAQTRAAFDAAVPPKSPPPPTPIPVTGGFALGAASRAELQGVHPALVRVVERAIQITTQDFGVHDGIRTVEEQRKLVNAGASQTMASKHLRQADGFGHAVDLVPFVNGKLRWEWPAIYPIASAMWQAARELGVKVRWGGAWINLDQIASGTPAAMEAAINDYGARQRAAGRKVFTDGPHFELVL